MTRARNRVRTEKINIIPFIYFIYFILSTQRFCETKLVMCCIPAIPKEYMATL
jgi:hypothetical protein